MKTKNDSCCQFYAAFKGERKHIMELLNHVCMSKGLGTYNNINDAVGSLNNVETRMYDFLSKDELEKVRPVYCNLLYCFFCFAGTKVLSSFMVNNAY